MSKFLVVLVVFLLAFKPEDLPGLVKFVTKIFVTLNKLKQTLIHDWYKNLQKDIDLEINNKKAQESDLIYMSKTQKKQE